MVTSTITFDTTEPSVVVSARCAPITSLFMRLIERAGLGAGEERDGHALHVVEQLHAQVEDDALTDLRREPALGVAHAGVDERGGDDERGEHGSAWPGCRRGWRCR